MYSLFSELKTEHFTCFHLNHIQVNALRVPGEYVHFLVSTKGKRDHNRSEIITGKVKRSADKGFLQWEQSLMEYSSLTNPNLFMQMCYFKQTLIANFV